MANPFRHRELPPPYSSVTSSSAPANQAPSAPASPPTTAVAIPIRRRNSPPPSYASIVPTSPSPPTTTLAPPPSPNLIRRRLSSAASSPRSPPPPAPTPESPSEDDTLAAILAAHPWRRTWGPRPRTLHTALCRASLIGAEPLVAALLAADVPVRYTSKYAASTATSAVHEALKGPAPHIAIELLHHVFAGAYTAAASADGAGEGGEVEWTAIEAAEEKVRFLLDARDAKMCTPLHLAAEAGETDIVQEMLARGAELDAADELGRTPLHMAARYGRVETVRYLVRQGADVTTIKRELWASAETQSGELGSFALISKLLQDVLDEQGVVVEPEEDDSFNGPRSLGRRKYSIPSNSRRPGQRLPHGGSSHAYHRATKRRSWGRPDAFSPRARETWANQPIMSPTEISVLSASLSTVGKTPGSMRRPPPSLWNNPLFSIWKRDCEKLQAEHRAQKERNWMSGSFF